MKNSKRRFKLINPAFQVPFLLFFTSAFLLNFVAFKMVVFFTFKKFSQDLLDAGLTSSSVVFDFLRTQEANLDTVIYITTFMGTMLTLVGGYYISHRIAGPIYRVSQDLNRMLESNEFKEIRLRKGDCFPELAQVFNQLIQKIKTKH